MSAKPPVQISERGFAVATDKLKGEQQRFLKPNLNHLKGSEWDQDERLKSGNISATLQR